MNTHEYLARIDYGGSLEPTFETLNALHQAHLHSVPFENLDIPLGREIVLSLPEFYEKVVTDRRGGFCYELNGLFGWLLGELGFGVEMLSARVYMSGEPGPEFDHMLLRVELDEPVIADVGFGNSFVEPLWLNDVDKQQQRGAHYRLQSLGDSLVLQRKLEADEWDPQYQFSVTPRDLSEFSPMCHYQQTSPQSTFTRKSVCSMASADGRVKLANGRLIITRGELREEREVVDEAEYAALLERYFGIDLGADARLEKLLSGAYAT